MAQGWPSYEGVGWRVYKEMVDDFLQEPNDANGYRKYTPDITKESRGVWCISVVRHSDKAPVYSFLVNRDESHDECDRQQSELLQCINAHRQERDRLNGQ